MAKLRVKSRDVLERLNYLQKTGLIGKKEQRELLMSFQKALVEQNDAIFYFEIRKKICSIPKSGRSVLEEILIAKSITHHLQSKDC